MNTRDTRHQPNVVSAARAGRGLGNPRLRRRIFAVLILVAVAGFATVALVHDRHVRAWAGAVGLGCLLAVMIGWLTGASGSLSESGRDPKDINMPYP